MSAVTLEEIEQDSVAMSIAKVLKLANNAAVAHGTDPASSAITISAEPSQPSSVWRIHYEPRDYISRRGGDLTVMVNAEQGRVEQVLRGQ
jgi:hypothetical protein